MGSPVASDPPSPQVRFFHGSRPPSPSLLPGMLNLEMVNEKLRFAVTGSAKAHRRLTLPPQATHPDPGDPYRGKGTLEGP
jgi:hypothetical protein